MGVAPCVTNLCGARCLVAKKQDKTKNNNKTKVFFSFFGSFYNRNLKKDSKKVTEDTMILSTVHSN